MVLRSLRPEGSKTQGPTEEDLLKMNFDHASLESDVVDVHLDIATAQLLFHGSVLRHFIHVKVSIGLDDC